MRPVNRQWAPPRRCGSSVGSTRLPPVGQDGGGQQRWGRAAAGVVAQWGESGLGQQAYWTILSGDKTLGTLTLTLSRRERGKRGRSLRWRDCVGAGKGKDALRRHSRADRGVQRCQ